MTKRNEKGFFLSETMVVIAVVAVVLIAVFKLFSSVYMNFEQSEKYDTAYAITALANVQKYYESVEKIDTSVVSRAIPYVELTNSETYNSDYYTKLKEEFEIDNIYLIDLQYIYDSSMYNQFYVTLRKYVKTLRNVNGIVLVITVSGNEFAYSKIENYGDVTLIGDASDEYALYIPKNGEFVDPGYENWSGDAPTITWEDGKTVDTSKPGTYYMHYDFNGYMLRRKVVVGSHEGVMYLNHLYNIFPEENGLMKDNTRDENLRYSGGNDVVKNYVEFGNSGELWRIIGVFEVSDGTKTEKRLKLVREDSIGIMQLDSSDRTVNDGRGINQWGESIYLDASGNETATIYEGADLMQILNNQYLSKIDVGSACYDVTDSTYKTCDFSTIGLSSMYQSMIEKTVWNTGALNLSDDAVMSSTVASYNAERGNEKGNTSCSRTEWCNDLVKRTTEWHGKVALPYVSDYAYASSEEICYTNMGAHWDLENSKMVCKTNNWMHYFNASTKEDATWMLSPVANSVVGRGTYSGVLLEGYYLNAAMLNLGVRPSVYLKSDIEITSGQGTATDPYKLGL